MVAAAGPPLPGAGAPGGVPWVVQWQSGGGAAAAQAQAWTPFDRGAAAKQRAREEGGWSAAEFESRFADLLAVLPDLPRALHRIQPPVLAAALADAAGTGTKLIRLKAALPQTNVGMMLLLHPPLLAADADAILAGLAELQAVLGCESLAEETVQFYPSLLQADILARALAELRRLLPQLLRSAGPRSRDIVHAFGVVLKSQAVMGQEVAWDPSVPG